jgi:hypothetical protein
MVTDQDCWITCTLHPISHCPCLGGVGSDWTLAGEEVVHRLKTALLAGAFRCARGYFCEAVPRQKVVNKAHRNLCRVLVAQQRPVLVQGRSADPGATCAAKFRTNYTGCTRRYEQA